MKKYSKIFANIAIIAKALPRKKNIYTYIGDTSFSIGDLVEIPFGKKTTRGIILSFHNTSLGKYAYKKIIRKIPSPTITPFQNQLALFFSREYLTPFGNVIRFFFFPKNQKEKYPLFPITKPPSNTKYQKNSQKNVRK
jgi:primosomal protein N'